MLVLVLLFCGSCVDGVLVLCSYKEGLYLSCVLSWEVHAQYSRIKFNSTTTSAEGDGG